MTWSATDRRLVGDRPRPVGDQLHQVAKRSPRGRRPVADQSATSPRSVTDQLQKPSCDSSVTSAIVLNFGRGEVAERLQCMSDWGLRHIKFMHKGCNYIKYSYIWSIMTTISFYLGMHCSMHNFLGINKQVEKPYQNILTVLILYITQFLLSWTMSYHEQHIFNLYATWYWMCCQFGGTRSLLVSRFT